MLTKTSKKEQTHECECGKKYKHRQSLSLHKKTCYMPILNDSDSLNSNKEIIQIAIILISTFFLKSNVKML